MNFRRSAFSDHAKSKDHLEAMRMEHEATRTSTIFLSAMESADKAMLTLLYAAYFIAKEDIAIIKFEKLTNLLQMCECPNLPLSLYRNRDGCHDSISVMPYVIGKPQGDIRYTLQFRTNYCYVKSFFVE